MVRIGRVEEKAGGGKLSTHFLPESSASGGSTSTLVKKNGSTLFNRKSLLRFVQETYVHYIIPGSAEK